MKKSLLLVPVLVLALVGLAVRPALAWNFEVSGKGVCNEQTGQYDITFTIVNPEEEQATVAESNRDSVSGTIDANSSKDYHESVAGDTTSLELVVELDWPSDNEQPAKTAEIELKGDCKPPVVVTPPAVPPAVIDTTPVGVGK